VRARFTRRQEVDRWGRRRRAAAGAARRGGITVMELMIALAIMVLLAAITIPSLSTA
jgi:Tfp pilus assembly protein FimT